MNRTAVVSILFAAGLSLAVAPVHPLALTAPVQAQTRSDMTLSQLERILQEEASDFEGDSGQWRLTIEGRPVVVLADANNNRMRIVAPIAATSELSAEQIQSMLLANFHTALDARYAVSDGTVVSLFVHPLSSLTDRDLRSGLSQVVSAADTFGTTYSSGDMGFGTGSSQPAAGDRLSI